MLPGPLSWTNSSRGQSIQNAATMALQEQLNGDKQQRWCGIVHPHWSVFLHSLNPHHSLNNQAMRKMEDHKGQTGSDVTQGHMQPSLSVLSLAATPALWTVNCFVSRLLGLGLPHSSYPACVCTDKSGYHRILLSEQDRTVTFSAAGGPWLQPKDSLPRNARTEGTPFVGLLKL